jgi:hypothetical protein
MALKITSGESLTIEIPTTDQALADGIIAQIQEFLKAD